MKLGRKFSLAVQIYKEGGPGALVWRVRRYISKRLFGWQKVHLSVGNDDVEKADWTSPQPSTFKPRGDGPYTINWVLPPPSGGSGGHNTMFRFVRYLENQGHTCRLYSYDPNNNQTLEELEGILKKHFKPMKAKLYHNADNMLDCDAVIATSWQTAYPVFNFKTDAKKFYFVQDFEPYFSPVGTESVLAENTYKFGLHGITAGRWLSQKLGAEYNMKCDPFEFGSDFTEYVCRNQEERKKILFYARPVTPRRGFEFGILALELFHKQHPEYEINMIGWNIGDFKLPFPRINHGILAHKQLNELYNQCAAGLVISFTNMSLLPLELISAGCIPVVNDGPNNRLVSDNPFIKYAPPSPLAMANALSQMVTQKDLPGYAKKASESVQSLSWDNSGAMVEKVLIRELHG